MNNQKIWWKWNKSADLRSLSQVSTHSALDTSISLFNKLVYKPSAAAGMLISNMIMNGKKDRTSFNKLSRDCIILR